MAIITEPCNPKVSCCQRSQGRHLDDGVIEAQRLWNSLTFAPILIPASLQVKGKLFFLRLALTSVLGGPGFLGFLTALFYLDTSQFNSATLFYIHCVCLFFLAAFLIAMYSVLKYRNEIFFHPHQEMQHSATFSITCQQLQNKK